MRTVEIKANDANQRLDKFMTKFFPNMPQSLIYKYIRKNCVKINKKRPHPDYRLAEGDVINFYINDEFFLSSGEEPDFLKVNTKPNIIYQDENIILANKPAGVLVHDDDTNVANTLINQIKKYLYDAGEYNPDDENSFVPSLCNRIDRNTQGIVIAAKNAEALRVLNEKIKNREITKQYLCIVCGHMDKKSDTLTAYLKKDTQKNKVYIYDTPQKDAKTIATRYTVLKQNRDFSLLDIKLITGRTHQIRAHMAYIGHPLLGDGKYGINKINKQYNMTKQALCSYKLTFDFPTDAGVLEYLKGAVFELENVDFLKMFE